MDRGEAPPVTKSGVSHCVIDERFGRELGGDPKPARLPAGYNIFSEKDDLLVEPAHFFEDRAPIEDVACLVLLRESNDTNRLRPALVRDRRVGKCPPLNDANRCVFEKTKTRLQPSGVGQAVIVGERDDRCIARPPREVSSSTRAAVRGVAHDAQSQPRACRQIGEHGLSLVA